MEKATFDERLDLARRECADIFSLSGITCLIMLLFYSPCILACLSGGFWPILAVVPIIFAIPFVLAVLFAIIELLLTTKWFKVLLKLALLIFAFQFFAITPFLLTLLPEKWYARVKKIGYFFPVIFILCLFATPFLLNFAVFVWRIFEPWYFNTIQPWFEQIYNHIIFGI